MKTASNNLLSTLKNNYSVESKHRLRAEWNMNRYVVPSVTVNADNTYLGAFPLNSVVSAERPVSSGIVKASTDNGLLANPADNLPARYYAVSSDDPYQYWLSQNSGTSPISGGGYGFATDPTITITYAAPVKTNKLTFLIENNFNTLVQSTVSIQTSFNGSWSPVANNITFDSKGKSSLFYQGSSWTVTEGSYLTQTLQIYGIRLTIKSVGKSQQPAAIIEISPRWVRDLSEYVISMSVDEELSDNSFISPIGVASSNQAGVTLSNTDGVFNSNKLTSPYYNILDRNVIFTGEVGIRTGTDFEYTTLFTMLSQSWAGGTSEEVQVSLEDSSSQMKIVVPPKVLFENVSVGYIISYLCDIMGFTNYQYSPSDLDISQRVDYFFTDGEKTLWEVISDLSLGTQTVVYFDSKNILQIKSRNSFLRAGRDATWNVNYDKVGSALPDLISYDEENQYEANSVDVLYTPTKTSDFNNGQPKLEVVWEPEDTVVLRAGALQRDMTMTDTKIVISSTKAATWPYEGLVSIDSEIIRFRGKTYRYFTNSISFTDVVIYSQEEKDRYDAMTPDLLTYRNYFYGELSVVQRGVNGSPINYHDRGVAYGNVWKGYITEDGVANPWTWDGGISVADSIMTLTTNYTFRETNNYCARNNGFANPTPGNKVHFGTRIRFREGYSPNNVGEAGIFFASNQNNFVGYWVSLRLTEAVEANNRFRNEVAIWGRLEDKLTTTFDHKPLEIRRGVWYDVDVTFEITATHDHIISVFVNGVAIAYTKLAGDQRIITGGGQHGIQVGNFSSADFEYYYSTYGSIESMPDTSTFYDTVKGGFSNGMVQSNWYKTAFYDDLGGLSGTKSFVGAIYFDDFGSIVHEVREFDVSFEKPVLYSKPYVTNEKVVVPAYYGTPFGAHFVMINAGREDAIVKGEDTVTYGVDNAVTQSTFIYGRQIYQEDEEKINIFSQPNINRRGTQKTQFGSPWMQNKATAQDLASWVVKQWGTPSKSASVEVFGNALFEVGDIVTVTYLPKDIYDRKYYVNRISHTYEKGLVTNLSLRSVAGDVPISIYSQNTGSVGGYLGQSVYISE